MPIDNWQNLFNNEWLKQIKKPETETAYGFNPDTAFGANMVPRSNLFNPMTLSRDLSNAKEGIFGGGAGLSSNAQDAIMKGGLSVAPGMAGILGKAATGSDTVGNLANTAGNVGVAALQGFENPASDMSALMSLFKTIRGFF